MKRILAAACVLAGVTSAGTPSHAGQWVVANAAGCKAWWPVESVPNLRAIWNGGCSGDLAHGEGQLVWLQAMTKVATYEGGMFAGRYHDFGTLKDHRCTIYRGSWVAAKPQGMGVGLYLFPRERIAELDGPIVPFATVEEVLGEVFEEAFRKVLGLHGRPPRIIHAPSRQNPAHSYYFEGDWANGAPNGTGVTARPGSQYRGLFRDGLPVGKVTAIDKKAAPDFGWCFERARVRRLF